MAHNQVGNIYIKVLDIAKKFSFNPLDSGRSIVAKSKFNWGTNKGKLIISQLAHIMLAQRRTAGTQSFALTRGNYFAEFFSIHYASLAIIVKNCTFRKDYYEPSTESGSYSPVSDVYK